MERLWFYELGPVTGHTGWPTGAPTANDGPVPVMLATELNLARSGAIDTDLLAQPDGEHPATPSEPVKQALDN